VQGFGKSFQDKYGGFNPWGDETRLSLGRMGMASADTNDAAGWWQGYDRYKNVVRNELFGASLTPGEQQAFEKSDITPSMSPKAIKDNLKLQSEIVKRRAYKFGDDFGVGHCSTRKPFTGHRPSDKTAAQIAS
jgi:hypothetical protein